MATGYRGTLVISWAQTELDGLRAAPPTSLAVGANWRWTGGAVRVDGPDRPLVLAGAEEVAELHRHAARAVRRLVGRVLPARAPAGAWQNGDTPEEPLLDRGFAVTDGRRQWTATLIDMPDALPLLMFLGEVPPEGRDLWVSHQMVGAAHLRRISEAPKSVICFTPETRIDTPEGPVRVAELCEGDLVLTRDDGPQPILWIGQRRISGARLVAQPELRPVRIRARGFDGEVPDEDLLVSPDHRMLLRGDKARVLFNEDEVLVRARDLIDDRRVLADRAVRGLTYVHLLLDRHQVVWANGLETESFHPASMPLDALDPDQEAALIDRLPEIARDPAAYGAFARRALTPAEAAIMLHAPRRAH